MDFLKDRVCVLFPAKLTVEIDTQILVNYNSLYRFPSDDNGRRLVILSTKVHNHLPCLPYMQFQVVPLTPLHKTVNFLSVVFVVVIVWDQSYQTVSSAYCTCLLRSRCKRIYSQPYTWKREKAPRLFPGAHPY